MVESQYSPSGVEAEGSICGNANLVVRDCAEDDSAGGSAQPVDDDGLARVPQILVSIDVISNSPAPVIHNPTVALHAPTPASKSTAASNPVRSFISPPPAQWNSIVSGDAKIRK